MTNFIANKYNAMNQHVIMPFKINFELILSEFQVKVNCYPELTIDIL